MRAIGILHSTPGKLADIIALPEDPLADITALERVPGDGLSPLSS